METDIENLALEIEASGGVIDDGQAKRVCKLFEAANPDIKAKPEDLASTEMALHLTDLIVPGWTIQLRGKAIEPDGHWSCTLRSSGSRDSDEYIGRGQAPTLTSAILAATLRVIAFQLQRRPTG